MCPLNEKQKTSFKRAWGNDERVKPLDELFREYYFNLTKAEASKQSEWLTQMKSIIEHRQHLTATLKFNRTSLQSRIASMKPDFIKLLR